MKTEEGNVSQLMATGICILAMTVLMMAYMGNVSLIEQKMEVAQLSRKYILRMETTGYLTDADQTSLLQELANAGVTGVELAGSTLHEISYGAPITLHIKGYLEGKYEFEETRVSTAKN